MQELLDGVFVLEGDVGGRPLRLMYLHGETASLLLDTGCANDPNRFIVPQIRESGGDPSRLTWIVNTHPDLDHTGGNYQMKQLAPQAILACGDADREACSDPEKLMRLRYDAYRGDHALWYQGDARAWVLEQSGKPQPIEVTFVGGERIRLSSDWEVEVVAVPGHAKGHIGILDRRHRAFYGGDAIHGRVYHGFDGLAKLPPTYLHVDDYLSTIRLIEHLPIDTYAGCHWPIKRGAQIADFCAESRDFVHLADRLLREVLTEPRTLREACLALGPKLGDWPHVEPLDLELMYALNGHLAQLVDRGLARSIVVQDNPRLLAFVMV